MEGDHPWSLVKQHQIFLDGVEFCSLAEVCQAAMQQPDPIHFVTEAAKQMPKHQVNGKLLFPITAALKKLDYDFWRNDTFWTTGMSTKATPLREVLPGQNMLEKVFIDAHVRPVLREHDYA